jgi:aarF domain-containing kinase
LERNNATEEEEDQVYNKLHDKYAPVAMRIILQMGGFYVKIGQMGSCRDDMVPPQYMKGLKTLQNAVPHQSVEYIKGVVEEELGCKFEDVFSDVDPEPLGAASIGQVHRATLKETGEEVVVKVQYPNVEKTFRWDMSTIMDFCRLAQPVHVPFLRECEKQFMTEFDYRLEAKNLKQVANNLRKSKYNRRVAIPMPHERFCSRKVLVMEYLKGKRLIDGIRDQFKRIAEQQGLGLEEFEEREREKALKGDSVGGSAENAWGGKRMVYMYQGLLRIKDCTLNFCRFCYNNSIGFLAQPMKYHWSELPLNIPEILDFLWTVHGHELFVDGFMNGDPHPGNIMLLDDGRIGLIDYGQVKKLDMKTRVDIAKLIIALAHDDKDEVVRVMIEDHNLVTKHMDPYVIYKIAQISWNRDDREMCEGKNIQLFFESLGERDPVISNRDEFIMPSRMAVMLRGLSFALKYPVKPAEIWLPFAEDILAKWERQERG